MSDLFVPDVMPVYVWHEGGVTGVYVDPKEIVFRYYYPPKRARNVLRPGIEEDE